MADRASEFRYEIAFSLLDQDEAFARRVSDCLPDDVEVFLYSQRQIELLFRDGVEKFAAVFKREARLVVIFCRAGWGQHGWTRIEAEAIKARLLDQGNSFVGLVMLDDSTPPAWFPRPLIWADSRRHDPSTIAEALAKRITESGGTVRTETLEQYARRVEQEKQAHSARVDILASPEGLAAANGSVDHLFRELSTRASMVGAIMNRYAGEDPFSPVRNIATLRRDSVVIRVEWRTPGIRLAGAELVVEDRELAAGAGGERRLAGHKFVFDLDPAGRRGWRASGSVFYDSDGLAEWISRRMLDRLRPG